MTGEVACVSEAGRCDLLASSVSDGDWRVPAYPKAFTCKCFINIVPNKQKSSGAGFGPTATSVQPLGKERENLRWNCRR